MQHGGVMDFSKNTFDIKPLDKINNLNIVPVRSNCRSNQRPRYRYRSTYTDRRLPTLIFS